MGALAKVGHLIPLIMHFPLQVVVIVAMTGARDRERSKYVRVYVLIKKRLRVKKRKVPSNGLFVLLISNNYDIVMIVSSDFSFFSLLRYIANIRAIKKYIYLPLLRNNKVTYEKKTTYVYLFRESPI